MDRKLTISISIGAAAGAGIVFLVTRRRAAAALRHWSRSRGQDDDVTIARKVETHIFRPHDAPKGSVSVDVEAGVVYLRGIADATWSARFAEGAREVPGVLGVKNLLHPAGTPSPTAPPRGAMLDRERDD
jgi:hypothetical protein